MNKFTAGKDSITSFKNSKKSLRRKKREQSFMNRTKRKAVSVVQKVFYFRKVKLVLLLQLMCWTCTLGGTRGA